MRVVAVPRVRPAPPVRVTVRVVSATPIMRLLVVAEAAAVEEGDARGEEEQHDVDDGKREAGLEHRAPLVRAPRDVHAGAGHPDIAQAGRPVRGRERDIGAAGRGDAAEVVDTRDQGAEEEGVDEGDEVGVARGAGVGEDGEEGPGEGEGRNDEEDEDGGRGERVCVCEAGDEPAEHAHDGDLGRLAGEVGEETMEGGCSPG